MVNVRFEEERSIEEVYDWVKQIQPLQRGQYPISPFDVKRADETLTIDLEALTRVLIEHKQYDQAKSCSPTRMAVLRMVEYNQTEDENEVIETGEVMERLEEETGKDLSRSTVSQHLGKLVEDGLVERVGSSTSGVYRYKGPVVDGDFTPDNIE